jgi:hypothetical protein
VAAIGLTLSPASPAHGAGSRRKNLKNAQNRKPRIPPTPSSMDDSTAAALEQLALIPDAYGGDRIWDPIRGVRYDITYTIPGPEGVAVRTWTESHIVWTKLPVRVRIDNDSDSTIVVLRGDTCLVRRDGAWTADSAAVATERESAREARWLVCIPWDLLGEQPKRRLEQSIARDTALIVRAEYGPGLDRSAGTIVRATFAPPDFHLRTVHTYDPRARAWFLLELANERTSFGWTWAERRTLRTSDEKGTPGAVVLEARIDNMTVASDLPPEILYPPGAPR